MNTMNIKIEQKDVLKMGDEIVPPLTDICPVCSEPLHRFPIHWVVFDDVPNDWFIHPGCVDRLMYDPWAILLQRN